MTTKQAQRTNFYEGQYLGAEDMAAIADYARMQQARHTLGAHTWGIAMGLQLKEKETPSGGDQVDVFILPGYAWDGFGRPIVVLSPKKLSMEKFKEKPDGLVRVWLRYAATLTGRPKSGFETCYEDNQYSRIQESFEIEVGDLSHLQQHDEISVDGKSMDAMDVFVEQGISDTLVCDESVPFQCLPEEDKDAFWFIPLGLVKWEKGGVGLPGNFIKITDENDIKQSRSVRRYIGTVVEGINAADGVIRLRGREKAVPSSATHSSVCEGDSLRFEGTDENRDMIYDDNTKKLSMEDLVWVEGNLRVQGDEKIFGGKLDFRDIQGKDNDVPLFIKREEDNGQGGKDLRILIGKNEDGNNRLTIGPEISGDFVGKLTILDNGNVGIGTTEPKDMLHVKADSGNQGIRIESGNGSTDRSAIRFFGNGNEKAWIATQNDTGRLYIGNPITNDVLNIVGGNVGIGTTDPEEILHIKGDDPDLVLDINSSSAKNLAELQFRMDNLVKSRIYWSKTDSKTYLQNNGIDSVTIDGSDVGIGTTDPVEKLDVRGNVKLGASGNLFAIGAVQNLRVVVGRVNSNGAKISGEGFIVTRENTGLYKVTFSDSFDSPPIVLVTASNANSKDDNVANTFDINSGEFKVVIMDVDPNNWEEEDSDFGFIALGERT